MMLSKYILLFSVGLSAILLMFMPIETVAQEGLETSPVKVIPQRKAETEAARDRMRQRNKARGDEEPLPIPFVDDFSVDHFPGNEENRTVYWTNRSAERSDTWAIDPPTIGVASFDGTDAVGYPYDYNAPNSGMASDTLETVPILLGDLEPGDNVNLSFYYQPGGLGDSPEADDGDSLSLHFYAADLDQWFYAWSTTADESQPFEFVSIPVEDARYFYDNFKFRFINYAKQSGSFDMWHVDYVWLDQGGGNTSEINNDVAFVNKPTGLLNQYSAVPWSHYREDANDYMKGSQTLLLRNLNDGARTLEDNSFDVYYEGDLISSMPNPNNPAIGAQSSQEYTHTVLSAPNEFTFPTDVNDTSAVFDVYFIHGVSDFMGTESNDTSRFQQEFSDYYAYDDGSPENSIQLPQTPGDLALGFNIQENDSIWGVDIAHSMSGDETTDGSPIYVTVWNEDENGNPGEIIAESITEVSYNLNEDYGAYTTYFFEEPVYVESGRYFVGFGQTLDILNIYNDLNTSGNEENLYWRAGGNWSQAEEFEGSIMMRPRLWSLQYLVISGRDEPAALTMSAYPNPANDRLRIQFDGYRAEAHAYNITGKEIWNGSLGSGDNIDVSNWKEGIYLLRLRSGQASGTAKIVVQR